MMNKELEDSGSVGGDVALYRWLVWCGVGICLLPLGYGAVYSISIGMILITMGAFIGITIVCIPRRTSSMSTIDWLTFIVSILGTMLMAFGLLQTPEVYLLYFIFIALLLFYVIGLSVRRKYKIPLWLVPVLIICFLIVPFILLMEDPYGSINRSVRSGRHGHLSLLLWLGASPNARDSRGPVLMDAVETNDITLTRMLLQHGADPNGKSSDFWNGTPVIIDAARDHDTAMVRLLLEYGADPDEPNNSGETALFHAARFDRLANAKMLLENGADVNARDYSGATPLFSAASPAIAKLLVEQGAEVHTGDVSGRTVVDALLEGGKADVIEYLQSVEQ